MTGPLIWTAIVALVWMWAKKGADVIDCLDYLDELGLTGCSCGWRAQKSGPHPWHREQPDRFCPIHGDLAVAPHIHRQVGEGV